MASSEPISSLKSLKSIFYKLDGCQLEEMAMVVETSFNLSCVSQGLFCVHSRIIFECFFQPFIQIFTEKLVAKEGINFNPNDICRHV